LKWILQNKFTKLWTEFIWLSISTIGELLPTRSWNLEFHRRQRN